MDKQFKTYIIERFNAIKADEAMTPLRRNYKYAELMTAIEGRYHMPIFDDKYEDQEAYELYSEISNARDFSIFPNVED